MKEFNRTVNFKFNIDQRVLTILEEPVIITMLGVDEGGIIYYVQGKNNSGWYKENLLTAEV
jgi:phage pi2 protein 07